MAFDDKTFGTIFPSWGAGADPVLGNKALFNMGDNRIATRIVETAGGTMTVQKQGNLVRMTFEATKTKAGPADCVPGPFTEVSRTYYDTERVYSSDRVQYIDRKRLKTLVLNNGLTDVTLCFASPSAAGVAVEAGTCFVETVYSERTYYDEELACSRPPMATGSLKGEMYAEFLVRRLRSINLSYKGVVFTYTFASPTSSVLSPSSGAVCSNQPAMEVSFLSRTVDSLGKLRTLTMAAAAPIRALLFTLAGGLLGPSDYVKGDLRTFLGYDRSRIAELSEWSMFGQAWHGKVIGYVAPSTGVLSSAYLLLSDSRYIQYLQIHTYGFYYKHPDAPAITPNETVTALGASFLPYARALNTEGNYVGTGVLPPLPASNGWLFSVIGAGTLQMRAVVVSAVAGHTVVDIYKYTEIEYGAAETPAIKIASLTLPTGTQATTAYVAPRYDGHRVLITLLTAARVAIAVHEITIAEDCASATASLAWVRTAEYVTGVVLREPINVTNITWTAGTFIAQAGDPHTLDQYVTKTEVGTTSTQVTRLRIFCVAGYTTAGVACIVLGDQTYGAESRYMSGANGHTYNSTRTHVWYNSALVDGNGVISYSIDPIPGGSWTTGDTTQTPTGHVIDESSSFTSDTTYPNRVRITGLGGSGTHDITFPSTAEWLGFISGGKGLTQPTLWEVWDRSLTALSLPAATSRVRVGIDVVEVSDATCLKGSATAYALSFPNWTYDPLTSTIVHDCICVI